MSIAKDYMGDGVYIEERDFEGNIVLTTEDGISVQNEIALEPQVIDAVLRYIERVRSQYK